MTQNSSQHDHARRFRFEFVPDFVIAIDDRHEALQARLAYDDGSLAEVPDAHDAYVRYQQFNPD